MNIKKRDTLAIVGGYSDTRKLFDWKRDDCDVLLFNEAPFQGLQWVERCDVCIQVHLPIIWRNPVNLNDPKHYERLKANTTVPVLMQDVYDDVPMSTKYPLEEIRAKYGDFLLTSSAAEAIAWGLYAGYKRIELYGVEMATNTEYATQRPGVTYWLGLARGILGMDNVVFYNTTFTTAVYGFEGDIKISEDKFQTRLEELTQESKAREAAYIEAEKKMMGLVENWIETGEGMDLLPEANKAMIDASYKLGMTDGAKQIVEQNIARIHKSKNSVDDFITNRQIYERDSVKQNREAERLVMEATNWGMAALKLMQFAKGAKGKQKRKYRTEEFLKAFKQYNTLSNRSGGLKGAAEENQAMMILLGELGNAAGGMKSLEVMGKVGIE